MLDKGWGCVPVAVGVSRRDVPFLTGQKETPPTEESPNRRSRCSSTHPVCSQIGVRDKLSPERGLRPGRLGERGRKKIAPSKGRFSVPSSCPSPSGEGTQGPGDGVRPIDRATGHPARPGPFAVRRLGRPCDAEGRVANRCVSEASCDSRPRREAGPSAAARSVRRLLPSPFRPVTKGASRQVLLAGSLGRGHNGPSISPHR